MEIYTVEGGYNLTGEVRVSGAKNVALKVLIASLLTDEEVLIENIPSISDVFSLIEMLKEIGVRIETDEKKHRLVVSAREIKRNKITSPHFSKLRASFLLMIPLLLRFREVEIPLSGGDKIGVRPIDRTIEGLEKMGAKITYQDHSHLLQAKKLTGAKYTFKKNTHTGTEALVMAATLAWGETVLKNASEEPEVDELIRLLNDMGAKIKRLSSRKIVINGVKKLHGTKFTIISDRNEIVTFICATIFTRGKTVISPVEHLHLTHFYEKLSVAGAKIEQRESRLFVNGANSDLKGIDIVTSPHPGFMTDWQAPWAVLMTGAQGSSVVHEAVFEKRFGYISELNKMGAGIELFNPDVKNPELFYNFNLTDRGDNFHAIRISGPKQLLGNELVIPDLRAGATLVLAALGSQGTSKLTGIEHIDRGYEKFEKRLSALGAKIRRVEVASK
ncbi:UDP-N-acetylglucosamine 1-carboxyvinyltransferase [Candidatus Microgenomates bacterium]|nr:UDP-N-acetylglucosamine 1-carboxyvinyltransferase [Candidatus Microgenomates bacterium]